MSNKIDSEKKEIEEVMLEGAAADNVQNYGSAIKEHVVAYTGINNETKKKLKKGLKGIADSKVNNDYKDSNTKQQAGFSAEVKHTARINANNIIEGNPERSVRTDDIGRANDQLYDHVTLDRNGNVIPGSGEQMKFVGRDAKECLSKLRSEKYEKYLDADATLTVPSDYYNGILEQADEALKKCEKQLERAKSTGNSEQIAKHEKDIAKLKKIKSNLKNSGITTKEAIEARVHPFMSTVKDTTKIAHKAGLQQAEMGAYIGGGLSLITNVVAVIKNEKDVKTAAIDIVKDTGKGVAISYTTAFTGSIAKGVMQNSGRESVRILSKTNIASTIVTSSVEIGKTMKKYVSGEISGGECLEEIGGKTVNQLSSAMYATIGQIAIPIPVVGAMIGSLVGYTLSNTFYKTLTDTIKEANLAHEERIRIEKECAEITKLINAFHNEMNECINKYLIDNKKTFDDAFTKLCIANQTNDVDSFIKAANRITENYGGKPTFESFSEFDTIMQDKETTFRQ